MEITLTPFFLALFEIIAYSLGVKGTVDLKSDIIKRVCPGDILSKRLQYEYHISVPPPGRTEAMGWPFLQPETFDKNILLFGLSDAETTSLHLA